LSFFIAKMWPVASSRTNRTCVRANNAGGVFSTRAGAQAVQAQRSGRHLSESASSDDCERLEVVHSQLSAPQSAELGLLALQLGHQCHALLL
jgi:hypothetical protein